MKLASESPKSDEKRLSRSSEHCDAQPLHRIIDYPGTVRVPSPPTKESVDMPDPNLYTPLPISPGRGETGDLAFESFLRDASEALWVFSVKVKVKVNVWSSAKYDVFT